MVEYETSSPTSTMVHDNEKKNKSESVKLVYIITLKRLNG